MKGRQDLLGPLLIPGQVGGAVGRPQVLVGEVLCSGPEDRLDAVERIAFAATPSHGLQQLAAGSVAITLSLLSPVIPPSLAYLRFVFNYTAALCLLAGLAMIWLSKAVAKRTPKMQTEFTG